ncbi:MAG: 30S ribosomal protein S8 [Candidatus Shapirobacteria bacterium]
MLKSLAGNKIMLQSFSIDFLIRIKNAYRAGKKKMVAPASNFCISIADLLKRYGYIAGYSVTDEVKREITLDLIYQNNQPKITEVKIFSKPGRRVYEKNSSLPWGKTRQSLIIISTSTGVISQKEAHVKGLGGEIIAEIY